MSDDEEKDEAESSEEETESSDSESSDSESSDSESSSADDESDSESSDSESSSAEEESDSESAEAKSDSDEDAEAKPEPVAAPKKGKKKKKKGAKSKSADSDEGGSDKAKRSTTKKGSAASRSSTRTASARTEDARPKKPGSPEDEETPWGLVAGAVAVAVACVIGLYYFNHQAGSEDEPTADIAIDTGDTAHDEAAPPSPSADPFAAPPDVAAPPANAQRTPSGLASRVIRPGTGTTHPTATDRVTVHYTGWTTDGQMFDSSRRRGEPTTFPLNRVIAGWTEGVQLMVVGEQRRFWIPEALAYQGRPGAPAGMLVFDVELIGINQ